jgi:hypothetical protein
VAIKLEAQREAAVVLERQLSRTNEEHSSLIK